MTLRRKEVIVSLALVLMIAGWSSLWAHGGSDKPEVRVTVTVVRHNSQAPRHLTAEDVLVYQNRERRPVVNWVPARGSAADADLAILVDDSLAGSFGNQIRDLKSFILALPPTTRVAVVYAMHGNASTLQEFTVDHARAAKALRLTVGSANEGSSIYMALTDLVKHWPKDSHRRDILLVSDGIDLYRGVTDSQPTLNPDLNAAVENAQEKGISVYTIFANDAGMYRRNLFLINNGQSCLSLLTLETGGKSFFQGLETPVAFQPYLHQLRQLLNEQYLLTFRAAPVSKPGLQPLRVTTEQPGIDLLAPTQVYVPASPATRE